MGCCIAYSLIGCCIAYSAEITSYKSFTFGMSYDQAKSAMDPTEIKSEDFGKENRGLDKVSQYLDSLRTNDINQYNKLIEECGLEINIPDTIIKMRKDNPNGDLDKIIGIANIASEEHSIEFKNGDILLFLNNRLVFLMKPIDNFELASETLNSKYGSFKVTKVFESQSSVGPKSLLKYSFGQGNVKALMFSNVTDFSNMWNSLLDKAKKNITKNPTDAINAGMTGEDAYQLAKSLYSKYGKKVENIMVVYYVDEEALKAEATKFDNSAKKWVKDESSKIKQLKANKIKTMSGEF